MPVDTVMPASDSALATEIQPRPMKGLLLAAIMLGLLFLVTWVFVRQISPSQQITVGGRIYTLTWLAYIIPIGAAGLLLITLLDLRGQLMGAVGTLVSFGFPTFGASLKALRLWYEQPDAMAGNYVRRGGSEDVLDDKHPFSKWMIAEIVHKYENNVQAMAYWGAAVLIIVVGLRGIQFISKEDPTLLIMALELEFSLLSLFGLLIFYKPEDHQSNNNHEAASLLLQLEEQGKKIREHEQLLQQLHEDFRAISTIADGNLKKLPKS